MISKLQDQREMWMREQERDLQRLCSKVKSSWLMPSVTRRMRTRGRSHRGRKVVGKEAGGERTKGPWRMKKRKWTRRERKRRRRKMRRRRGEQEGWQEKRARQGWRMRQWQK